jgi:hypothetical protein
MAVAAFTGECRQRLVVTGEHAFDRFVAVEQLLATPC